MVRHQRIHVCAKVFAGWIKNRFAVLRGLLNRAAHGCNQVSFNVPSRGD